MSFLASCEKDYYSPSPPVVIPSSVSFSTNIVPIFSANCAVTGCHTASSPPAGLDLTPPDAYNSLFNGGFVDTTVAATTNTLYVEVSTGKMPPSGKLSAQNVALILAWIQQGAKNN